MNFADQLLEIIPGNTCLVLYFCPVVIDGVHRIAKEFGNLGTVVYTQTDQSKNTKFRIQQLIPFQYHLFVFKQKRIKL